jgi:uncharacterized protein YfaS (alpha-2-macroglobulin family)
MVTPSGSVSTVGTIWAPSDQYRPGDTIHGYIFLREISGENSSLGLVKNSNRKFTLSLISTETQETIKILPIHGVATPIIAFQLETDK